MFVGGRASPPPSAFFSSLWEFLQIPGGKQGRRHFFPHGNRRATNYESKGPCYNPFSGVVSKDADVLSRSKSKTALGAKLNLGKNTVLSQSGECRCKAIPPFRFSRPCLTTGEFCYLLSAYRKGTTAPFPNQSFSRASISFTLEVPPKQAPPKNTVTIPPPPVSRPHPSAPRFLRSNRGTRSIDRRSEAALRPGSGGEASGAGPRAAPKPRRCTPCAKSRDCPP